LILFFLLLFGTPGLFNLKKIDNLIEHELSIPYQFDLNLKRFCVFHKQDFNTLAEEQRQKLLCVSCHFVMNEDDHCRPDKPCPKGFKEHANDETGTCFPTKDIERRRSRRNWNMNKDDNIQRH
jgi:hypothetical protein